MVEVYHILLNPALNVVIYESVLHLLFDHAPPLLSELSNSRKHRYPGLCQVWEVRLDSIQVLFYLCYIFQMFEGRLSEPMEPLNTLDDGVNPYECPCPAYTCTAMNDHRRRRRLLQSRRNLPVLLNVLNNLVKFLELCSVSDGLIVFPRFMLQLGYYLILGVV